MAAEPPERNPILYTFPACCAPTVRGVATAPASEVSRKRRLSMPGAHAPVRTGIVNVNVDPTPTSLFTQIRPP